MDTKLFIEKLHQIFCDSNKSEKKYSEVWLSNVDFGGLYHNDKFILNVKAEHEIDSCYDAIDEVIQMLNEKAKDELKMIWSVNIYNVEDKIHCVGEELMVYSEQNSCV